MLTLSGLWGGVGLYTAQLVLIYCYFLLFFLKDSIFIYVYACISLVCKHVPVPASQTQIEGIITDDQTTWKAPGESAYRGLQGGKAKQAT